MKSFVAMLLSLAAFAAEAYGATLSVPCDFLSISNALASAKEGDVVQIGAGQCTWQSPIVIDRGISFTIRGAGTNQTTLVSPNVSAPPLWIKSNSKNVFTVSDLNCIGQPNDINGFFVTGPNPPAPPMNGPMHFYNIQMPSVYYRGINIGGGDSFGLVDHCYFETAQAGQFNPISFGGNEYRSWANPNPLGTTNAVVVEDCYFKTRAGWYGNGFFDCYNGAQVVVRHNTFDGAANTGAHGYDSQVTSVRTGEIYANVFTNITGATTLLDWRGGTLLWFSNKVYAPNVAPTTVMPLLKYYRGCPGIVSTIANWVNVPQVVSFAANPTDGTAMNLINQPPYVFKAQITSSSQYRQVVIGPTLADTVSNLVSCINLDPAGAGIRYSSATFSNPLGRNTDVQVVSYNGTSLTLKNILDGSNPFGWPAAFQQGIIGVTKYTNTGVTRYPCYSWGNYINGVKTGFGLAFITDACSGINDIANLLQSGRDYFQDTDANWNGLPPGYAPLIYPHPLNVAYSNQAAPAGSAPSAPTGFKLVQ